MPRRAAGTSVTNGTAPSINEVAGSMLDNSPSPGASLKFPKETSTVHRRKAREIFRLNPYLGQAQLPAVLRYIGLTERYDAALLRAEGEDFLIEDRFGGVKENPIFNVLAKIQTQLVAQERHLAIAIPARSEQVAKKDQKPLEKSAKSSRAKNGVAKLRLA